MLYLTVLASVSFIAAALSPMPTVDLSVGNVEFDFLEGEGRVLILPSLVLLLDSNSKRESFTSGGTSIYVSGGRVEGDELGGEAFMLLQLAQASPVRNGTFVSWVPTTRQYSTAEVQATLRGLYYFTASRNPTLYGTQPLRNISVCATARDGRGVGVGCLHAPVTVRIHAVNDAPHISTWSETRVDATFVEGDVASSPLFNVSGITDVDDTSASAASVHISRGCNTNDDWLYVSDTTTDFGSLLSVYDTNTCTLWLNGTATWLQYSTALNAVRYANINVINPNTAHRFIVMRVLDGDASATGQYRWSNSIAAAVAVSVVNAPPSLHLGAANVSLGSGSASVLLLHGCDITDADDIHIRHAAVRISGGFQRNEDVITLNSRSSGVGVGSGVTANWAAATGSLTLQGVASLHTYATLLQHLMYENTASKHSRAGRLAGTRNVTLTVCDNQSDRQAPVQHCTNTTFALHVSATATVYSVVETGTRPYVVAGNAPTGAVIAGLTLSTVPPCLPSICWLQIDYAASSASASWLALDGSLGRLFINTSLPEPGSVAQSISVVVTVVLAADAPAFASVGTRRVVPVTIAPAMLTLRPASGYPRSSSIEYTVVAGVESEMCIDVGDMFEMGGNASVPITHYNTRAVLAYLPNNATTTIGSANAQATEYAVFEILASPNATTWLLSSLSQVPAVAFGTFRWGLSSERVRVVRTASPTSALYCMTLEASGRAAASHEAEFDNSTAGSTTTSRNATIGGSAQRLTHWPTPANYSFVLLVWTRDAERAAGITVASIAKPGPGKVVLDTQDPVSWLHVAQAVPLGGVQALRVNVQVHVSGCTDPAAAYVPCWGNGTIHDDAVVRTHVLSPSPTLRCDNECVDESGDGHCDALCNVTDSSGRLLFFPVGSGGCTKETAFALTVNIDGNYNPQATVSLLTCNVPYHRVVSPTLSTQTGVAALASGSIFGSDESIVAGQANATVTIASACPPGLQVGGNAVAMDITTLMDAVSSGVYTVAQVSGQMYLQFRNDFRAIPITGVHAEDAFVHGANVAIQRRAWPSNTLTDFALLGSRLEVAEDVGTFIIHSPSLEVPVDLAHVSVCVFVGDIGFSRVPRLAIAPFYSDSGSATQTQGQNIDDNLAPALGKFALLETTSLDTVQSVVCTAVPYMPAAIGVVWETKVDIAGRNHQVEVESTGILSAFGIRGEDVGIGFNTLTPCPISRSCSEVTACLSSESYVLLLACDASTLWKCVNSTVSNSSSVASDPSCISPQTAALIACESACLYVDVSTAEGLCDEYFLARCVSQCAAAHCKRGDVASVLTASLPANSSSNDTLPLLPVVLLGGRVFFNAALPSRYPEGHPTASTATVSTAVVPQLWSLPLNALAAFPFPVSASTKGNSRSVLQHPLDATDGLLAHPIAIPPKWDTVPAYGLAQLSAPVAVGGILYMAATGPFGRELYGMNVFESEVEPTIRAPHDTFGFDLYDNTGRHHISPSKPTFNPHGSDATSGSVSVPLGLRPQLVVDLLPGWGSSSPDLLTAHGDCLYFTAYTCASGRRAPCHNNLQRLCGQQRQNSQQKRRRRSHGVDASNTQGGVTSASSVERLASFPALTHDGNFSQLATYVLSQITTLMSCQLTSGWPHGEAPPQLAAYPSAMQREFQTQGTTTSPSAVTGSGIGALNIVGHVWKQWANGTTEDLGHELLVLSNDLSHGVFVLDLAPAAASSAPSDLTCYKGQTLFIADDGRGGGSGDSVGRELRAYNVALNTSYVVWDSQPAAASGFTEGVAACMTPFQQRMYIITSPSAFIPPTLSFIVLASRPDTPDVLIVVDSGFIPHIAPTNMLALGLYLIVNTVDASTGVASAQALDGTHVLSDMRQLLNVPASASLTLTAVPGIDVALGQVCTSHASTHTQACELTAVRFQSEPPAPCTSPLRATCPYHEYQVVRVSPTKCAVELKPGAAHATQSSDASSGSLFGASVAVDRGTRYFGWLDEADRATFPYAAALIGYTRETRVHDSPIGMAGVSLGVAASSTVVIGAPGTAATDTSGAVTRTVVEAGAVHVFAPDTAPMARGASSCGAAAWSEQAVIQPTAGLTGNSHFGAATAIHGTTVVVGAPGASRDGAFWVFDVAVGGLSIRDSFNATVFTHALVDMHLPQANDTNVSDAGSNSSSGGNDGIDTSGAGYGSSVAVFANVVLVAAPRACVNATWSTAIAASAGTEYGTSASTGNATPECEKPTGIVVVWTRNHNSWQLFQVLSGYDVPGLQGATRVSSGFAFGCSVAVDYGVVAIAACGANDGVGAVYIYKWNAVSGRWQSSAKTTLHPFHHYDVPLISPADANNGWISGNHAPPAFGYTLALHGALLTVGAPGLLATNSNGTTSNSTSNSDAQVPRCGGTFTFLLDAASGGLLNKWAHYGVEQAVWDPPCTADKAEGRTVALTSETPTMLSTSWLRYTTASANATQNTETVVPASMTAVHAYQLPLGTITAVGPSHQSVNLLGQLTAPHPIVSSFGLALAVTREAAIIGTPHAASGVGRVYVTLCSSPCRQQSGMYQVRPCTATGDVVCAACDAGPCPTGTVEIAGCTSNRNRKCAVPAVPAVDAASVSSSTGGIAVHVTPQLLETGESCGDAARRRQRIALGYLYAATRGHHWLRGYNWTALLSSPVYPCDHTWTSDASSRLHSSSANSRVSISTARSGWDGIHCDSGGWVVGIQLPGAGLVGTLPQSLFADLPRVRYIDLSSNTLSGQLPSSMRLLNGLERLDVHNNALVGPLPLQSAVHGRLTHLDVSGNPALIATNRAALLDWIAAGVRVDA